MPLSNRQILLRSFSDPATLSTASFASFLTYGAERLLASSETLPHARTLATATFISSYAVQVIFNVLGNISLKHPTDDYGDVAANAAINCGIQMTNAVVHVSGVIASISFASNAFPTIGRPFLGFALGMFSLFPRLYFMINKHEALQQPPPAQQPAIGLPPQMPPALRHDPKVKLSRPVGG